MKDRNVIEEAMFDRDRTAQEVLMEQGRVFAQTEYESGELNDWIEDEADTHDTFLLAHCLVQWLDSGEPIEAMIKWIPVFSLKDFRANIEHVIERKAVMIMEDQ
jgi:hypothetical protein